MQHELTTNESRKIRLALYGSSPSCLTYNALRIAQAISGDWSSIAIIDTTETATKYAHLGMFTTVNLSDPFSPQRYYEAIELCSAMDVIIINSISPEYQGVGGVLDQLNGGDYEAAMRSHRAFLTAIRESEAHIICTANTRSKLTCTTGGKIALLQKPVQQEGLEKYFTTVLQLDRSNRAIVVKVDTGLLPQKQPFAAGAVIGVQLLHWCNETKAVPDNLQWRINGCATISELYQLLFQTDTDEPAVLASFTKRRLQLEGNREVVDELLDLPF